MSKQGVYQDNNLETVFCVVKNYIELDLQAYALDLMGEFTESQEAQFWEYFTAYLEKRRPDIDSQRIEKFKEQLRLVDLKYQEENYPYLVEDWGSESEPLLINFHSIQEKNPPYFIRDPDDNQNNMDALPRTCCSLF